MSVVAYLDADLLLRLHTGVYKFAARIGFSRVVDISSNEVFLDRRLQSRIQVQAQYEQQVAPLNQEVRCPSDATKFEK